MKTPIEIMLPKGHYLSMVEPFKSTGIPTNSIIKKLLAGVGITTYEILYAKHHSIIILPNLPVITSKVKDHNSKHPQKEILGVHKGIDVNDIKAYLLKDIQYKKILTTPEGFMSKVLPAFEGNEDHLYNDFFLLFDECERIITDISYRGAIAAPLDKFFDFKNKALVSATTLPFSSELFKDFEHYVIKPDFDYSQPLTVVPTNNVIAALGKVLENLDNERVCIFLNSTNGINAILNGLGIEKESAVFCAQESVVKLLLKKFKNATSEFDEKKMLKYNFFTSRYFSAIDMIFDEKPDVIMISDMIFADHSMLDPHTEVIQIAGRFRKGVKSLTHIASFNPDIEVVPQSEALKYYEGCLDIHEELFAMLTNDKSKSGTDMLKFLQDKSPVASFYIDGKRNPFMLDNALNEARVTGYYKDLYNLQDAYIDVIDHFTIMYVEDYYPVSDVDLRRLKSLNYQKEMWREAAHILSKLIPRPGHFTLLSAYSMTLRNSLTKMLPFIAEAVRLIGLNGLEETGYVRSSIDNALRHAKKLEERKRIEPYVYEEFSTNTTEIETSLLEKLNDIAETHQYKYKVSASLITHFFDARRTTEQGLNVWKIRERLIDQIQQKSNS